LIPISFAESSSFAERVQHESGYDGVYFQCLSDWHDTCLSKGLRSAGGGLLSRWHAARTGIGSKRIDEEIIHELTATSPVGIMTDTCDMYLVAAAKDGDHHAYAELCRRHSQQVFRKVLRITGNIADAEDTLQEALLKGYVHIRGFEGRSAFSSWLTRIAINSALMLLRRKRSQPVYSFESDPEIDDFNLPEPVETSRSPEESCIQNALENELAQAIRYLPPNLRVVMQIRYREDSPIAEIAKMLGISESAVKSRLARARLQIRKRLGENRCLRRGIDSRTLSSFNLMSVTSEPAPLERRRSGGTGIMDSSRSS
jgi:RNA polymerase sigma factor (sigma-70 family)